MSTLKGIVILNIVLLMLFMVLILSGAKAKGSECDVYDEEDIEVMIAKEAIRQHVSVDLALAVAKTESSMNPKAVGSKGELGLFQVMPYHSKDLLDVRTNIRVGISLLKQALWKCSDMGQYAFICYNNGIYRRPRFPELHPYYLSVARNM